MAADLLKGRKERQRLSVNRKYEFDYINYDSNYPLQGLFLFQWRALLHFNTNIAQGYFVAVLSCSHHLSVLIHHKSRLHKIAWRQRGYSVLRSSSCTQ